MLKGLDGKVAVVTGGASGIGLALAEAFVEEGMRVVIADVDERSLQSSRDRLEGKGAEVAAVPVDVSRPESVEALAEQVFEQFGACHVLCNNAGVGAPSAKVWETTPNDWRWVFGVNVMGVVNGILAFVPRMLTSGQPGHIINTSSPDGGIEPLPTASVYAASKSAVSTLTECLAAQLREEGGALGASIFYPSGGLLRTGLWTADRTRPPELAREKPRPTEPLTPEGLEEMARHAGHELRWQSLDQLADLVVAGIKDGRFIMMLDLNDAETTLQQRAARIGKAELPLGS
jgi:NAD(P)-dependent dehydrogenase (short-subunit alcohol dehydrogenase family)